MCGWNAELEAIWGRSALGIAAPDTAAVLVVFARFPDETTYTQCATPVAWPDSTQLPVWADSLFENEAPWDTVGSATHYFDVMSNHQHQVTGHVIPHVEVLDTTITHYAQEYGGQDSRNDELLIMANQQLLRQIQRDTGSLTADQFDENNDGHIDMLWIYWRSGHSENLYDPPGPAQWPYTIRKGYSGTGTTHLSDSVLTFSDGTTKKIGLGMTTFGNRQLKDYADTTAGAVLDWPRPLLGFAHEYMHNLAPHGTGWFDEPVGHIGEIGPYGRMDGRYAGGAFFSAYLLDRLKWIDPIDIDSTSGGGDTTLVIPAVPDPNGYVKIHTRDPNQVFYLELRNEDSPYVQFLLPTSCRRVPDPGIGLLVTHSVYPLQGYDWDNARKVRPEVATGMFDTNGDPDPVSGLTRASQSPSAPFTHEPSDLFNPGHVNVLGTYTNPSTDLHEPGPYINSYTDSLQSVISGITIYNVEWANAGSDDSIRVSIHFDTRATAAAQADTIRVDTEWDGLVQLTGDVVVDTTATLTVTENADVYFGPAMDRRAGGADTSLVELIVQGRLDVAGSPAGPARFSSSRDRGFVHFVPSLSIPLVDLDPSNPDPDTTVVAPGAQAGDWYGIRLLDAADSSNLSVIKNGEFRYAERAISPDGLSGNLQFNKFSNNTADIYLEGDTIIPSAGRWHLQAPTRVVASNVPAIRKGPPRVWRTACGPSWW